MLTLYIKSIDKQEQLRTFDCQVNQLEAALDTLSLIAAAGNVLLEAYIMENGQRTTLSHQAFDGRDMLRPIRALQTQWEALLSQPKEVLLLQMDLFLLELTLQRIDQYESQMASYDCSISKLEQLLLKAQQRLYEGARRNQLTTHYQALIAYQHKCIDQSQVGRDEWLKKLARLKQVREAP